VNSLRLSGARRLIRDANRPGLEIVRDFLRHAGAVDVFLRRPEATGHSKFHHTIKEHTRADLPKLRVDSSTESVFEGLRVIH
jgi:hypothetical protein